MCKDLVVVDTTKVRIFKQITTAQTHKAEEEALLLIPQRYEFSSKSQHVKIKGNVLMVVVDTTKVRIFKQITTKLAIDRVFQKLLLIPQRYEFSSKSQHARGRRLFKICCC